MTKPNPQQQQQQQQESPASATSETPKTHKTPVTSKGPAPIPPARGTKRLIENLSPSPVSNETDLKKSKPLDSETLNQKVCEAQGMDYQSSSAIDAEMDKSELEQRMLYNMNNCLNDVPTYEVDGRGTSVGVNVFLQKVVPELMKTMITACADQINKTMNHWMSKMEEKRNQEIEVISEQFQAQVMRLKYENDANEQYSRRESVKVFGLKEESDEDPEKLVTKVFKDAGVDIDPEDFHAVHRNGPPRKPGDNSIRPILVKFVSRKKKQEVMRKKKTLKEKEGYDKTYVLEDLTPLRSKLLKYIKNRKDLFNLAFVWTSEGKILCQPQYPKGLAKEKRPRAIVIESPDELFKIGAQRIDYEELGLDSYRFI